MKKVIRFLILSPVFVIVHITSNGQNNTDLFSTNYITMTVPQDYNGEISYLNSSDMIERKNVGAVKHDKSILPSFPNLVSTVTLYQVDNNGNLSLIGNSLSKKNSIYIVIYDYTQTQTIQVNDASSKLNLSTTH